MSEFIDGMRILFTENYDKTSKFIFEFYDFDGDGYITKDDVLVVLSYVTLNIYKIKNENYLNQNYPHENLMNSKQEK